MSNVKWNTISEHERPPHRRVEDCSVVEDIYKFGKQLGTGSFGLVIEATNIKTGKKWAMKKVHKEKAGKSTILLLEREVAILKKVHHKHIIGLNEVIESPKAMYLFMELCLLGELKTLLDERGPFTEISTRHIITCLTDSIVYLHRNGIVHRDLKLENILVADQKGDDKNPLYEIKLTDFGLSVEKGKDKDAMLQTTCGTPVYMAPEVIQNHDYTQQCDMWSVGVILYALLSKNFPFVGHTEEILYETIKKGLVVFPASVWKNVSGSAKDLVERLLTVDTAYRLTAIEVNSHPWIQGYDELELSRSRPTNVLDLMKDFNRSHPSDFDSCDDECRYDSEEDFDVYNDATSDENKALAAKRKKERINELNQKQADEVCAASSSSKKHDASAKSGKPRNRRNLDCRPQRGPSTTRLHPDDTPTTGGGGLQRNASATGITRQQQQQQQRNKKAANAPAAHLGSDKQRKQKNR